ncbi:diguanylate cyclase [Roseateles sp. DAIF2]|nr:diguanylate cyclase [Roseateles sp. DAIF2]
MQSSPRIAGWIVAGNLLVACVLILATLINLQVSRDSELARAREAAQNLVQALSSELAAELRLVDNALATIALRQALSEGGAPQALQPTLLEQRRLLPFVLAIRTADASGRVSVEPTATEDATSLSVADRDYFRAARASDALVLSEPLRSRVTGDWCIVAARRLQTESGQFRGVVYAVLSAQHFQGLFRRLSLGKDGAIALRSDSLRLVARHSGAEPDSAAGLGSDQTSPQLRNELARDRESGWYITPTALDGIERISAYRRLPGYPLTVLAGFGTQHYLEPWRSAALRHWAFTAATLLLVACGSCLLYALHRREHRTRVQIARLAKEQSLLLENDLIGMLRVRQRRILWANRAACHMLGYPAQQLIGASTRVLYAEDSCFEMVGEQGYAALRSVGRFRTQVRIRTSDGRTPWVDLSGAMLSESESIWMLVDIDNLKHSEEDAQHLALHDPLTGLANRRLLQVQLHQALMQAKRSGQDVAVAYLDLDGFKPVNDRFGHEAGDAVLRTVASRLANEVRANDTLARIGGDEFVLVLVDIEGERDALVVLQRCLEAVHRPIPLGGTGEPVAVGCSIGLALRSRHGGTEQALQQAADDAMYAAKRAGRGRVACAPTVALAALFEG